MSITCRRLPILDVDVYFCTSLAELQVMIRGISNAADEDLLAIEKARGCCITVTDAKGRDHRLMCVFLDFSRDGIQNTIIHEAVHYAWLTLRHVGFKVTATHGEEPLCVITAYLADEMLKIVAAELPTLPPLAVEPEDPYATSPSPNGVLSALDLS